METEAENESFVAKSRPCEGHFAKRDFDSLFGPFFYQKAHSAWMLDLLNWNKVPYEP